MEMTPVKMTWYCGKEPLLGLVTSQLTWGSDQRLNFDLGLKALEMTQTFAYRLEPLLEILTRDLT